MKKNKEIRDNKIVLKNRILASESNLCLGSILLIKIWFYLKRAKRSVKITSKKFTYLCNYPQAFIISSCLFPYDTQVYMYIYLYIDAR